MKIIISPAKKMNVCTDLIEYIDKPQFLGKTERLLTYMKSLTYRQCRDIWKCNDKIAELNYRRFREMNLTENLTPAVLSYEGLQYQYMAPSVMDEESFAYLQEHLRILSGFYGILRPFDGVVPYRLEMQSKMGGKHLDSLYEFWGKDLAQVLFSEDSLILNLASREYSQCISGHLQKGIKFVTCIFGEVIDGKVKEKGIPAKMARGEMVRFLAENRIKDLSGVKTFDRLGYRFCKERSDQNTFVFIKAGPEKTEQFLDFSYNKPRRNNRSGDAPKKLCAGIGSYSTELDGNIYMCTLIDRSTKKVEAFAFGKQKTAELVYRALDNFFQAYEPGKRISLFSSRNPLYRTKKYQDMISRFPVTPEMPEAGTRGEASVISTYFSQLMKRKGDTVFCSAKDAYTWLAGDISKYNQKKER